MFPYTYDKSVSFAGLLPMKTATNEIIIFNLENFNKTLGTLSLTE